MSPELSGDLRLQFASQYNLVDSEYRRAISKIRNKQKCAEALNTLKSIENTAKTLANSTDKDITAMRLGEYETQDYLNYIPIQIRDGLYMHTTTKEFTDKIRAAGGGRVDENVQTMLCKLATPGWLTASIGEVAVGDYIFQVKDRIIKESVNNQEKWKNIQNPKLTTEEYCSLAEAWAAQVKVEFGKGFHIGVRTAYFLLRTTTGLAGTINSGNNFSVSLGQEERFVMGVLRSFASESVAVLADMDDVRHESLRKLVESFGDISLARSLFTNSVIRELAGEPAYTVGLVRNLIENAEEAEEPFYKDVVRGANEVMTHTDMPWVWKAEDYLNFMSPEDGEVERAEIESLIGQISEKITYALLERRGRTDGAGQFDRNVTGDFFASGVESLTLYTDLKKQVVKALLTREKKGAGGNQNTELVGAVLDLNPETRDIFLDIVQDGREEYLDIKKAFLEGILSTLSLAEELDAESDRKKESKGNPPSIKGSVQIASSLVDKKGPRQMRGSGRKRKHKEVTKEEGEDWESGLVQEVVKRREFPKPKLYFENKDNFYIPEGISLEQVEEKIKHYNESDVVRGKLSKVGKGPKEGGRILMIRVGRKHRILAEVLSGGRAEVIEVIERSGLDDVLSRYA